MELREIDLRDLQRAANQIMVRRRLRPSGWFGIVFGAFALYVGFTQMSGAFAIAAILLGVFLGVGGALMIVAPTTDLIIIDGIGIALLGLFNISATFIRKGSSSVWLILGLWQLKWAYDAFSQYRIFSRLAAEKPSPRSMQLMADLMRDPRATMQSIGGSSITLGTRGLTWSVHLIPRAAIFVASRGRVIIVHNKQDVLLSKAESEPGESVQVTAPLIGDTPAAISRSDFAAYTDWRDTED